MGKLHFTPGSAVPYGRGTEQDGGWDTAAPSVHSCQADRKPERLCGPCCDSRNWTRHITSARQSPPRLPARSHACRQRAARDPPRQHGAAAEARLRPHAGLRETVPVPRQYLAVVAHEHDAVARVNGPGAEVTLLDPHGSAAPIRRPRRKRSLS